MFQDGRLRKGAREVRVWRYAPGPTCLLVTFRVGPFAFVENRSASGIAKLRLVLHETVDLSQDAFSQFQHHKGVSGLVFIIESVVLRPRKSEARIEPDVP